MRILITGGSGFIGTNLVESLASDDVEVMNFDCRSPLNVAHRALHRSGDILDRKSLFDAMREFAPDVVVHLAARVDLQGTCLSDYRANIEGVQNMIDAVSRQPSVERAIFTSSRYVHANEHQPKSDDEYSPFTFYGQSKVEGEKLVRASGLEKTWLIVRPTSIWGPWFDIPYKSFFTAVRNGMYVHPQGEEIFKSYGYVGNVVHEIRQLIGAARAQVHGRTMYLADYVPIELQTMAAEIRQAFSAPSIRELPIALLKLGALGGDLCKRVGWHNPPLSSFRLKNLRTPMIYDLSATADVVGELPFTWQQGVRETVRWMKSRD